MYIYYIYIHKNCIFAASFYLIINLLNFVIMSKGSSYWGTATGKIGNTVVRVRKGTRVESMYQPNVANPRTEAQVYQRGKFQDAVGFYKRAVANFFKLAFEDKKSNETDYNAFMRYNVSKARVYSKQMISAASPGIPFMGEWIMSAGSLSSPQPVTNNNDTVSVPITFASPYNADTTTMGNLFGAIIKEFPTTQNGDILTIVRIQTGAASAGADELNDQSLGLVPGVVIGEQYQGAPVWVIDQYVIDTASAEKLSTQRWFGGYDAGKLEFAFNAIANGWDAGSNACALAVIISRKTASGLLTSNSVLTWNLVGKTMLNDMSTDNWLQGQRKAWGSSDVILAGSLV